MTSHGGRILCTEDDADTRDLLIPSLTIRSYTALKPFQEN